MCRSQDGLSNELLQYFIPRACDILGGEYFFMIVGMSEDRLSRIGTHIEKYIKQGRLPGAAILVMRNNQEAYYFASGFADVERKVSIGRDTVYRIYSMTKPITSVALLTLYEQGLFQLDDPIERHIPAWARLKVYESGEGASLKTCDLERPMTIKHLLTHTSGLTYGFMQSHPVDAVYREKQIGGGPGRTLEDMIKGLAEIPLLFQPGARWHYSVATDVCGYLVQHFSGKPLDQYVEETILEPLDMAHTGFSVKPEDKNKLAACYSRSSGGFQLQDDPKSSAYHGRPSYLSGGGGMVSTIDDYSKFATFLAGYGVEPEETPILAPRTRYYMLANHLPGHVDLAAMGQSVFAETSFDGVGFGLGVSVVVDPVASSVLDRPGAAGWGGAASTYFWIEPDEGLVVVFMTQLLPSSSYPIRRELKTLVNQAVIRDSWEMDPYDRTQDFLDDPVYDDEFSEFDGSDIRTGPL